MDRIINHYDLRDMDHDAAEGGGYAGDDSPEQQRPAESGRMTVKSVFRDSNRNIMRASGGNGSGNDMYIDPDGKFACTNEAQPSEAECMREGEGVMKE